MKTLYATILIVLIGVSGLGRPVYGQRAQKQTVHISGIVRDNREFKPNAFVTIKALPGGAIYNSDRNGAFSIHVNPDAEYLLFTKVGFKDFRLHLNRNADLENIAVELEFGDIAIQEVVVSSGYQTVKKSSLTGSVDLVDSALFNRTAAGTVLERLENITPGLLINKGDAAGTDEFLIRGRSTITAEAKPLIVLDNFPYDGNLDDLNPADIESVSILKDASAASIWGARAGNGVIVLTSRKGKEGRVRVNYQGTLALKSKPDLYNLDWISSKDRLEVEKFLFEQGYYDGAFTGPYYNQAPPYYVEQLAAGSAGIDRIEAELSKIDVRDDLTAYFYRTGVGQQHNLSFSGGKEGNTFFYSAGYNENTGNLIGQKDRRLNLSARQNFGWKVGPKISLGFLYTDVENRSNNNAGYKTSSRSNLVLSPYTDLVDETGVGRNVYQDYRKPYLDTIGGGLLQDWTYNPYADMNSVQNSVKRRDFQFDVGVNQRVFEGLSLSALYKFEFQTSGDENQYLEESYFVRDRINNFSELDYQSRTVSYNIPLGGIMMSSTGERKVHQGRLQLDYKFSSVDGTHRVNAVAGYEARKLTDQLRQNQYYGYRPEIGGIDANIDNVNYYPMLSSGVMSRIGLSQGMRGGFDHFLSSYANVNYGYRERYLLYGSFRKDEANLFGVATNQKGTPLWSVGGAWNMHNETFFNPDWGDLKLRASYGVNGNISRAASAATTIVFDSGGASHSLPIARVKTPSNEQLRWEKVKVFNTGVDFRFFNSLFSGSVDYYVKNSADLLAEVPVNPSYGVQSVFANTANMKGQGVDIQLNMNLRLNALLWNSSLMGSWNQNEVTKYLMPVSSSGRQYLPITINPVEGRTLYAVNSFIFRGLDHQTGDPIGSLHGESSMDYSALYNDTPLSELQFHGSAQPTFFGAFRNTLSYRDFGLSFNISYKGGYYFRRQSVYYGGIFGSWGGHSDYAKRWQEPGDELETAVPSMRYPLDANRDNYFKYSSPLVLKGDHVRFEDVLLSYQFKVKGVTEVKTFLNFQNLNWVLWKSNSEGIDPYFNNVIKDRMISTVGVSFGF